MKDLVLLLADKNAQFALRGALERPEALGIRAIEFDSRVHPGRDGGARKTGPEVLALERGRFRHALLVFDFEGCGTDLPSASEVEAEMDERLSRAWGESAKCIVIEPELDIWIWGSDNAVEGVLGWQAEKGLREWLQANGFPLDGGGKPIRPKEALEAALRTANLPRSSALYYQIAATISLRRCVDAAFLRLREQLGIWFPR